MNTLQQALSAHLPALNKWKQTGALPDPENIKAIVHVYEKLWAVKPDIGPGTVSLNCGSCLQDMMKALYNNLNERPGMIMFKGVPDKGSDGNKLKPLKVDKTVALSVPPALKPLAQDLSAISFSELKTIAASKGVKIYGKKRHVIEAELKAKK